MGLGVGDAPEGRSATRAYLGANRGNAVRERPRVSARSDAAHRDARALPPNDEICRLPRLAVALGVHGHRAMWVLVHVDKPPVVSEARRWVL